MAARDAHLYSIIKFLITSGGVTRIPEKNSRLKSNHETCLLLLISMLWHRQAIFKAKGDKLCSSAECRIWTRGPRQQIASRLNAHWQTDLAIEDQAKKLELDSPYTYIYIYISPVLRSSRLISLYHHRNKLNHSKIFAWLNNYIHVFYGCYHSKLSYLKWCFNLTAVQVRGHGSVIQALFSMGC